MWAELVVRHRSRCLVPVTFIGLARLAACSHRRAVTPRSSSRSLAAGCRPDGRCGSDAQVLASDVTGARMEALAQKQLWRHPCFIGLFNAAEFLPSHVAGAAVPTDDDNGNAPLALAALLLEQMLPQLEPSAAPAAWAAVGALQFGAQLAKAAPLDSAAWSPKVILRVLQLLVSKLRGMKEGEMAVVPACWAAASPADKGGGIDSAAGGGSVGSANGASGEHAFNGLHAGNSVLLLLRRRSDASWDVAVCTACAGCAYHPNYRQPLLVSEDAFDPILTLHKVPSERLVDSAPWLALYRGLAVPYATREEGARFVYEVLLPFFADEPLPRAIARAPPPPCLRRVPAPATERSTIGGLIATALEGVCGLLTLAGVGALRAKRIELEMRATFLSHTAAQLAALADGPNGTRPPRPPRPLSHTRIPCSRRVRALCPSVSSAPCPARRAHPHHVCMCSFAPLRRSLLKRRRWYASPRGVSRPRPQCRRSW